jgi:hypothetical protein
MRRGVGENIGALVSRAWQNGYVSRKKKAAVKPAKRSANGRRKAALRDKRLRQNKDDLFGFMVGQFYIVGDIESPIPDWAHWRPAKNI